LHEEFKRFAHIFYQTIYPSTSMKDLDTRTKETEKQKSMFLQRLFFASHFLDLRVRRGRDEESWPYPLAAALAGGKRILFQNNHISLEEAVHWFLTGDIKGVGISVKGKAISIAKKRPCASHSIKQQGTETLTETNCFDGCLFMGDCVDQRHHMINISLGGYGGTDLYGRTIGAAGERISTSGTVPLVQHGSVYLYKYKGKPGQVSGLLVGIEASAPLTRSMEGVIHNALSPFGAGDHLSAFNGPKLDKLIGEYNELKVTMEQNDFRELQELWVHFSGLPQNNQKEIMKRILMSPSKGTDKNAVKNVDGSCVIYGKDCSLENDIKAYLLKTNSSSSASSSSSGICPSALLL
jgi:hypothetical protein